jgi:hypothetical protein
MAIILAIELRSSLTHAQMHYMRVSSARSYATQHSKALLLFSANVDFAIPRRVQKIYNSSTRKRNLYHIYVPSPQDVRDFVI